MRTVTLKLGYSILARVGNELISGRIIGSGTKNGKTVLDLDNGRFVYLSQIIIFNE